jgi:hypothetical protein
MLMVNPRKAQVMAITPPMNYTFSWGRMVKSIALQLVRNCLLLLVIILCAAFVLSGISEHGGFLHTYVRDPPKTLDVEKLDAVFTAACNLLDRPPRPCRPCPRKPISN